MAFRPSNMPASSALVSKPTFCNMVACATEPRMSCRHRRQSNEIDSVNCATSAAGPAAKRPLRETGVVLLVRFNPGECWPDRAESHAKMFTKVVGSQYRKQQPPLSQNSRSRAVPEWAQRTASVALSKPNRRGRGNVEVSDTENRPLLGGSPRGWGQIFWPREKAWSCQNPFLRGGI